MYHDFRNDPRAFQENNVLYHYPVNGDRLVMGKFCSIACGAVFLFTSANHALGSLSTYPFPIFFTEWGLDGSRVTEAWDNKGDIVLGNDVWVGYEAVILSGVTIGDGAIIGARALVTQDVPPYTIVGGVPARPIRQRFPHPPGIGVVGLAGGNHRPAPPRHPAGKALCPSPHPLNSRTHCLGQGMGPAEIVRGCLTPDSSVCS